MVFELRMDLCSVSQSDSRYNRKGASGDGWSYGASGLRWRCRSLRQHDANWENSVSTWHCCHEHQMMCIFLSNLAALFPGTCMAGSQRWLWQPVFRHEWQPGSMDLHETQWNLWRTLRHHSPMLPPWRWSCTCGWGTHVSWSTTLVQLPNNDLL